MHDVFGITITFPDREQTFGNVFMDYNGTLARGGELLHGIKAKLRLLSSHVNLFVLTADTFGTARKELADLAIKVLIVSNGAEKAELIRTLGKGSAIAIGNGKNDVEMFQEAQLSIGIMGPEGIAPKLIVVSNIVVPSIAHALDLLLEPRGIVATLRD